jgi:hypothetical protein
MFTRTRDFRKGLRTREGSPTADEFRYDLHVRKSWHKKRIV